MENNLTIEEKEKVAIALDTFVDWNRVPSDSSLRSAYGKLTDPTPSEFPCEMEVDVNPRGGCWEQRKIEFMYDNKAFELILDNDIASTYHAFKVFRPIPKVKTLADLKEGDKVWCNKTVWFKGASKYGECFTAYYQYEVRKNYLDNITILDNSGENHGMDYEWFNKHFQLTPPTPAQLTAAKQAAIEEVERRFAELEKEVQG